MWRRLCSLGLRGGTNEFNLCCGSSILWKRRLQTKTSPSSSHLFPLNVSHLHADHFRCNNGFIFWKTHLVVITDLLSDGPLLCAYDKTLGVAIANFKVSLFHSITPPTTVPVHSKLKKVKKCTSQTHCPVQHYPSLQQQEWEMFSALN